MTETGRRLAAIMFTDIVGFTSLAQRDEARAMRLLTQHKQNLRDTFPKYGGREVKTMGDAFLVEFASALDAVKCAILIQQEIHERNLTLMADSRVEIRIGVHVGDVIREGGDILGDAVNISSRIEPLAAPSGICISEQTYDQVRNKVDLPLLLIEKQQLKNVKLPLDVYKIEMPWEKDSRTRPSVLDRRRVGVLPFRNMSPDPNDEYFAEGMTEELITSLSWVKELSVIARTSVMLYKTATKRVSEIGRELGAGTLIEGSVRKAGNRARITVQLVDAENESHIWAQNYDKQIEDIFSVQSEIAEKVTSELKVQLLESEKQRLEKKPTESGEAYTLYLKGRHYWNERSEEGIRRAIEYFKKATDLDPDFALGYSGLSDCYHVMAKNGLAESGPGFATAKEYATKALELDPNLAEAHAGLGSIFFSYELDLKKSEIEFRRAIELKPSYATAHQWFAHLFGAQNRPSEAKAEIRKALELDPFSLIINLNAGDQFYYDKEYEKAIEQFNKVLEMESRFVPIYPSLIQAFVRNRMYDKAFHAIELYAELTNLKIHEKLLRAYVFAAMGRSDESVKLLREVEESNYQSEHVEPYNIAMVKSLLGDKEGAFQWLEKAYSMHDGSLPQIGIDYEFDGLRNDPRYRNFLNRIGLSVLL